MIFNCMNSFDFTIHIFEISFIFGRSCSIKREFNFSCMIPNFISRKPICIIRKLDWISRKSICIGRKWSCMSSKPIFKKIKKDSCAGILVSYLWNQNSFVWIQISFVRNPLGNGIELLRRPFSIKNCNYKVLIKF